MSPARVYSPPVMTTHVVSHHHTFRVMTRIVSLTIPYFRVSITFFPSTSCPLLTPSCPLRFLFVPFVSSVPSSSLPSPLFFAQAETEARESIGVDPMSAERYDDEFGVRNSLLPGLRTSQTLPEHTRDALEFNAVPNDYDGACVRCC